MSHASEFAGKKIAVIGAAATGLAAAPVLSRLGAAVRVYDSRPAAELGAAPEKLRDFAELRLGDPGYPGIEECDLIVPSPGVPMDAEVLQAAVRRGTPVLSEIEVAYRLARAPIVAVTGTNGKTTTVMMSAEVLGAEGGAVQVAGNVLAGGFQVPLVRAAEEVPAEAWIVSEVSSFQLEWVAGFRPRIAVITNITADHLNRHKTVERYVAAKARLLESQTASDWTVLNLENPATRDLMPAARGRLLRFGRSTHEWEGTWTEERGGRRWIRGRLRDRVVDIAPVDALKVPGEHTVENALAAAAVGLAAGIAPEAIGRALGEFRGVADRMELVRQIDGVDYVNNTMCTNVDAAVRSIEAYSRPVVLIAGGRNKDLDLEPLGRCIAERVKSLVAIGTDGPHIAESARRHGFDRIRTAGSMEEAVRAARDEAEAGDVVLLAPACASFDWYSSFEERGRDFRQQVNRLVENRPQ
ncbi:MAG: UDP-N-acetylmuramoyl-L-alanine--D-glutamate ligase [Armatimonadota bacterium]